MTNKATGVSWWPEPSLHPVQRRYLAEDLVRLRRSDEQRRYVAPQRAGKIDPNPHQIEAVIFALSRHRAGGCILADEVGLGNPRTRPQSIISGGASVTLLLAGVLTPARRRSTSASSSAATSFGSFTSAM